MGKIRSAQVSVSIHQHLCLRHHLHAPLWVLCPQFFPWLPFKTQTHLRQSFVQWTRNHLDLCRSDNRQLLQHSCMSTELMVRMTLAGFYVAGVTQLKCECLCGISPSAMPPLLGFHACFHLRRFLSRCLSTVPKSRVREREREKRTPVCGFMSRRLVSSNPSLSLLIASLCCVHSKTSGSIFVSISCWITGAVHKTIWHDAVFNAGVALCDAVLPCPL